MGHMFTKKAEADGVGKAGAAVVESGARLEYLILHGYAEPAHVATAQAPARGVQSRKARWAAERVRGGSEQRSRSGDAAEDDIRFRARTVQPPATLARDGSKYGQRKRRGVSPEGRRRVEMFPRPDQPGGRSTAPLVSGARP
jgi:hypothetical protein